MKTKDLNRQPLEKLIEAFVAMVGEEDELFGMGRIASLNRLVDRTDAIGAEILSRGDAGTDAMIRLTSHEDISVRCRAAAKCLLGNIDRDRVINVLADICDLRAGRDSMNALDALLFAGEFDMKTGPKRRPG